MPRLAERPEIPSFLPRAVLADDHLMVMEGIAELLAEQVQLVALAATGRALVDAIGRTSPDLVITDVNMPHGSGLDAMKSVRAAGTKVSAHTSRARIFTSSMRSSMGRFNHSSPAVSFRWLIRHRSHRNGNIERDRVINQRNGTVATRAEK
jgi:DNA-binding NtrC family response regulator